MQHFKWTKAHAVYLPQVDAEHRNLFRMADELQTAARTDAETGRVLELMRALAAAVEEHFAYEERLMKAAACPDFDWHRGQHDAARKRIHGFMAELEAGATDIVPEMLDYFGKWIKDHLSLTDRMMGAHLRNHERLHAKLAS